MKWAHCMTWISYGTRALETGKLSINIAEAEKRFAHYIYETLEPLHDGKWLWIPLDEKIVKKNVITLLKIKRKPNRK